MNERICDQEILRLIEQGKLFLRNDNIWKYHGGWKRWHKLSPTSHPKSGRLRYNIRLKKRQRTIYRNCLIWMIGNQRTKAEGQDIHHRNYINWDDRSENLVERDATENRRDNFTNGFQECAEYFEELAKRL